MRFPQTWLDYAAYLAARVVATAFSFFSIETNLRTMRAVGSIWFYLPDALPQTKIFGPVSRSLNKLVLRFREHRRRAEEHIRLAFPEFDAKRVSQIAHGSMQQLAMLAVEVLSSPRLITQWTWAHHVKLTKLDEAIRILLGRRGCIMLTAHYGNWELLGYTLATLGFDITAVFRPLDNPYLNRYLLDRRERGGLKLLYKKGATKSASDIIESGGALCFIADQNAGSKGLFVDFFGRKASTYKSIGLLAIEHNVPILVGCARRHGPGFEYTIHVNRIIRPEEWHGRPDELLWITQEYSTAMESFVRQAPEQYLWIHRRWKSRPKEERLDQSRAAQARG